MTDRELDALIAEHLFNAEFSPNRTYICVSADGWEPLPCYSTDPAACALVKAELREREWILQITIYPDEVKASIEEENWKILGFAEAATEERAVCLAVLKALGE